MSLRIGLDLILEPTTLTGTGIYARSLLQALAAIDKDNQYTVFVHYDNLPAFFVPAQDNFRFQAYKFNAQRRLTRRLTQQALFAAGGRPGLDLLHSFSDVLPLLYRGRCVLTVHDLGPFAVPRRYGLEGSWLRPLIARSVAKADQVIAVSGHTQRDLRHYLHTPAAKVTVVPHGVGVQFCPQARQGDQEIVRRLGIEGDYILFVGRLERGKGLLSLLEAYYLLPEEVRARYSLALVGPDDNLATELRRRARAGTGRVAFTGYVEHSRLPALYRGARALVLPSVYEGFGLPLLEAMACGTPVVATRVSSITEVVGDAGLLVAPGGAGDLAFALERLGTDERLRADLAARGLRRAQGHTWAAAGRRTLAVYQQVAGGARR